MYTLIHLAVLTGTVLVLAQALPGVHVKSRGSALAVALVFAGLNWVIGWLLTAVVRAILFLPAMLTLGLVLLLVPFVVNTILLWITDKVLHAFELRDGKTLLISSGVITLVGAALQMVLRR